MSTMAQDGGRQQGAAVDLMHIVRINEEIKHVVAVAFRINIMALNAIFLAKRAGSAALGFGVLSNELRVFSNDLRESMMALTRLIHAAVSEVSIVLQGARQKELIRTTAEILPDASLLQHVLDRHQLRHAEHAERIDSLRRQLWLAVEDAARLVELGGILAKSAKIEAAYGGSFAVSLGQVSGEFDGVVGEIRQSLDKLRHSRFFRKTT